LADQGSLERRTSRSHPIHLVGKDGFVALTPFDGVIPKEEWESLTYFDWKSGGDTNFAPLASADGELECRGFWDKGKPDKDAIWTSNADKAPTMKSYVESIGANFGRVRIIKLEPATHEEALKSFHRDDNNRLNPEGTGWVLRTWIELTDDPDSYMLLMDIDEDRLPIPGTERRVPLPQYSRFVVDTQRLWHVAVHRGNASRYALITCVESTPELEGWIQSQVPALV
jgi:hypothetical protein